MSKISPSRRWACETITTLSGIPQAMISPAVCHESKHFFSSASGSDAHITLKRLKVCDQSLAEAPHPLQDPLQHQWMQWVPVKSPQNQQPLSHFLTVCACNVAEKQSSWSNDFISLLRLPRWDFPHDPSPICFSLLLEASFDRTKQQGFLYEFERIRKTFSDWYFCLYYWILNSSLNSH